MFAYDHRLPKGSLVVILKIYMETHNLSMTAVNTFLLSPISGKAVSPEYPAQLGTHSPTLLCSLGRRIGEKQEFSTVGNN